LSPPSLYVEILLPQGERLGGGNFGSKGRGLMNGIIALEKPLTPLSCEVTVRDGKLALTKHQIHWHLDLGLPSLQKCEK
jgi:hypothetical protein